MRPELFYWHREAKSSNAELDYVLEMDNTIVPLEVKAAKKGAMKSLHMFLAEKKLPCGVRVSAENFGLFQNILVVPLYAVAQIPRLVRGML